MEPFRRLIKVGELMRHISKYDENKGVLHIRYIGGLSTDEHLQIAERAEELPLEKSQPSLIDLSDAKTLQVDRNTGRKVTDMINKIGIEGARTAIVEASPLMRFIMNMYFSMIKQGIKTKFFDTCEEAFTWLKEK